MSKGEIELLNDYNLFFNQLCNWLTEICYVNNRGWDKKSDGMSFYSFQKGIYRIEIKRDWDLKYSHRSKIEVEFIDCSQEFYSNNGFVGYMGQKQLLRFEKPFTRTLFDEIINHFNM